MAYIDDVRRDIQALLADPVSHSRFETLRKRMIELTPFSSLVELKAFMLKDDPANYGRKDAILSALVVAAKERMDDLPLKILLTVLLPGLLTKYRFLRTQGTSEDDAWSGLQWGLVEAVHSLSSGQTTRVASNLVHNALKNALRNSKEETALPKEVRSYDGETITRFPGPENQDEPHAEGTLAGFSLTPEDAVLILRTRVEDQDLAEVAADLGLAYQTAKKRRQRAEALLRSHLKNHPEQDPEDFLEAFIRCFSGGSPVGLATEEERPRRGRKRIPGK